MKKGRAEIRYWTEEEHERFLEGLEKFGQKGTLIPILIEINQSTNLDLKAIAGWVGTRSVTQVRSHMQKYFEKQKKQQNPSSPTHSRQRKKQKIAEIENQIV